MKYSYNHYNGGFFWNKKDRWVFDTCSKTTLRSWDDIVDSLCQWLIIEEKNEIPLMMIGQWIDNPEMKLDNKSNTFYVKKIADNVKNIEVLCLDYDKDCFIEEFRDKYKHLTYLLYTSHSHTIKTPENDRFRVLIPMTTPIPVEYLKHQKEYEITTSLGTYFDKASPETWDVGRGYFVPACSRANKKNMKMYYNEGVFFDWEKELELIPVPPPAPRQIVTRPTSKGAVKGHIVIESLNIVEFFKDKGLYIAASSPGKHLVECPDCASHTNQDKTGSVIIEGAEGWGFRCQHGHGLSAGDKAGNKWLINYYGIEEFRPYCEVEEYKRIRTAGLMGSGQKKAQDNSWAERFSRLTNFN